MQTEAGEQLQRGLEDARALAFDHAQAPVLRADARLADGAFRTGSLAGGETLAWWYGGLIGHGITGWARTSRYCSAATAAGTSGNTCSSPVRAPAPGSCVAHKPGAPIRTKWSTTYRQKIAILLIKQPNPFLACILLKPLRPCPSRSGSAF